MKSLGLSSSDLADYIAALLGHHTLTTRCLILDTDHNVQGEAQVIDGQVTVDATADITRSASVTLYDADHLLALDSAAPVDGALYLDRMIQLAYQVTWYPEGEPEPKTITCPIFTGPIDGLSRDDATVSVSAQGKEKLSQKPAWRTMNYQPGNLRTALVRSLLAWTGETRFSIEPWSLRSAHVVGITFETPVWSLAKDLAGDRMLYYDGAGTAVMRKPLTMPVFTFRDGDGGSLLTKPQITYSTENVRNVVRVKGGIPKGAKYPVQYTAYAPANHPLSAQSLGRNGYARHLVEIIEDQDLLTVAACKARADLALALALKTDTAVAFDGIPIPTMEWGDLIGVNAAGFTNTSRLDQFTLPCKAGESMSYGYNDRRSTLNKARIRGRRR